MSRPLRILVAGGWYHVVNRGQRRERIFLNDEDRRRFLGLVAELPERFGVEVHAFVLMNNHYHLLLRTPDPNLSHAIRWLQVSHASRFNWAHRTVGHVFQGRFKAQILQDTDLWTLPLGLKSFESNMTTEWGLYGAASLIVMLPVVALFLVLSKWLVSGLTLGSVKG